jgi:(1->4)-alpha-D-glucan 1-alpha-D-glucosylmutase
VATDEINYRRFFDINELAAICIEHRPVFEDTHRLVFDLLDRGIIQGLRIDHPDGLYDPREYLRQLQEWRYLQLCRREWESLVREQRAGSTDPVNEEPAVRQWRLVEQRVLDEFRRQSQSPLSPLSRPLYVVVEKILSHKEGVPEDWPVYGTVGYKFLNQLNSIFVARSAEKEASATYTRFTGQSLDFRQLAYHCKRLIVRTSMASELNVLGFRLDRISERNRWTRDFTLHSLTRALQEVMACFSIYRTYVAKDQVGAMWKRQGPVPSGRIRS